MLSVKAICGNNGVRARWNLTAAACTLAAASFSAGLFCRAAATACCKVSFGCSAADGKASAAAKNIEPALLCQPVFAIALGGAEKDATAEEMQFGRECYSRGEKCGQKPAGLRHGSLYASDAIRTHQGVRTAADRRSREGGGGS